MSRSPAAVRRLLAVTAAALVCVTCSWQPEPSSTAGGPASDPPAEQPGGSMPDRADGADPASTAAPARRSGSSGSSGSPDDRGGPASGAPEHTGSPGAGRLADAPATAGATPGDGDRSPPASVPTPPDPTPPDTSASPPPFALRGVIEGAYSTPYTHPQRTTMLTWMAAHGMNTYVHAPKLDPYADFLWRTPYPAPQMADFATEIDLGEQLGINWIPAVRPGSDLCFSCPADRSTLVAKFQPFVTAGSRSVMVSFDDVATQGTDADRAIYGTGPTARGLMTSDLLNAVKAAMPGVDVLTVLSEYTGTTSTPFYEAVAGRLASSIDIFWTGVGVVSPTITLEHAQAIDAVLGRQVIIWDNYPVNDYSGTPGGERRLYLGPFEGLDPDLTSAVQGVLANVQSPWALNTVSLATLADFLDRPNRYDAETSWRDALAEVGGPEVTALTKLAENSRSSMYDPTESIVVGPLLDRVRTALSTGLRDRPAEDALRAELRAEIDAAEVLRSGPNVAFATGAARWIDVLEQNAEAAIAALDLAIASMPRVRLEVVAETGHDRLVAGHVLPADVAATQTALAVLQPIDTARRAAAAVTHGDRVGHPESVGPGNRIDLFVDAILALPRPTSTAVPTVLVDGQPSPVDFHIAVPDGTVLDVLATDPSGARTHERF